MNRTHAPRIIGDRPGFTTVELLIAITASLVLMAGGVALFSVFQRGVEQQQVVRNIQTQVHRSAEPVIRLVRNSDQIEPTSTSSRLGLSGGMAQNTCGHTTCWIELGSGSRLIVHSATPGVGREVELANSVDSLRIWYGIFDDQGRLDAFSPHIPSGQADDVLAVKLDLYFSAREARGHSQGKLTIHAARRTEILHRLAQ